MSGIIPVPGTGGFPLWALLLSVLLTGGGGAALWNMISARMSTRAVSQVTASTANLNDVAALNSAITGLAGENGRLAKRVLDGEQRLADVEAEVVALKAELNQRPTKEELKSHITVLQARVNQLQAYVDQLRNQLIAAGLVPELREEPTKGTT